MIFDAATFDQAKSINFSSVFAEEVRNLEQTKRASKKCEKTNLYNLFR